MCELSTWRLFRVAETWAVSELSELRGGQKNKQGARVMKHEHQLRTPTRLEGSREPFEHPSPRGSPDKGRAAVSARGAPYTCAQIPPARGPRCWVQKSLPGVLGGSPRDRSLSASKRTAHCFLIHQLSLSEFSIYRVLFPAPTL